MTEFASFLIPSHEISKDKKNAPLLQSLNFNEPETPMSLFDHPKRCDDDTMQIFLRLRPGVEDCYETPNECDVYAIPPLESASYRNFTHGYGKTSQKFTFSKLFSGSTNQDIIFNETTKSLLNDFVKGNDRLLFTYGTTSSGKTYTMNGQKRNAGIIPKSLVSLFNSVQLSNDASIMPVDFSEVKNLDPSELQRILKEKTTLLKLSEKESTDVLNFLSDTPEDCEDKLSNYDLEYKTTFWITFTEIYNEMIYDLLDINQCINNGNNKATKRPILDIRTARNGGSYVKGLSCYPVFSAEEAYRFLLVGRRSQKTGATRLNQNSSRSHTIFTIRAVRTTTSSRYLTRVSNFSFCDLAGSERTDKAQTSGVSQKEANNINSSLLALGRCIDILRRNQKNPGNMNVVPFRDSKLTRLFQTYLTGNGTASMIVCINPDPQLFDETIQVLKFSALAREVVLQEKVKVDEPQTLRKSHFCRLGLLTPTRKSNRLTWGSDLEDNEDSESTMLEDFDEENREERFIEMIESLKEEIIAIKMEKRANEKKIVEQLNIEWSNNVAVMEADHSMAMQKMRDTMNNQMMKLVKTERKNAYAQMKKRKIQHDSSEEEDENIIKALEIKLAAKEKEVIELGIKLKEAEEDSVDARQIVDIRTQELEKVRLVSKQEHTLLHNAEMELKKLRQMERREIAVQVERNSLDSSDCSILTIEADTSARSNSSTGSRYKRFSSFSSDKKINVTKISEPPAPPMSYFGPLQSPERSTQLPEPVTVKKRVHLFEINEEDTEDETFNNNSFLQHEADFKILDLEAKLNSQQDELDRKTVALKEMTSKLEQAKKDVTNTTNRVVSQDKAMLVLNNDGRYIGNKVDSIATRMGVLPTGNSMDVPKKLDLILITVNNVWPKLSEGQRLKECIEEEEEEYENIEPVRVTRSHNPEVKAKRTRRKK